MYGPVVNIYSSEQVHTVRGKHHDPCMRCKDLFVASQLSQQRWGSSRSSEGLGGAGRVIGEILFEDCNLVD